jgi:hypothetical protein
MNPPNDVAQVQWQGEKSWCFPWHVHIPVGKAYHRHSKLPLCALSSHERPFIVHGVQMFDKNLSQGVIIEIFIY